LLEAVEERILEALRLFDCVEGRLPQSLVLLHEGFEVEGLLRGCEVLAELGVMDITVDIGGGRCCSRRRISASNTRKKERKKERKIY
jgi:hypothetical protein